MLRFYKPVCPFFDPDAPTSFECTVFNKERCVFSYATARFINCPHYLNELQKKIKKHKDNL